MRRHLMHPRLFASGLLAAAVTVGYIPAASSGASEAAAAAAPPRFTVDWVPCANAPH